MASERIESSDNDSMDERARRDADVSAAARRPTAAGDRDQLEDTSDPDVLVAQIEATREDLAETLDAIADKVSPKNVAARGKQKLAETVKEKAATAREVVQEKAATAKSAVQEKATQAKEARAERATTRASGSSASSVRVDPLPPTSGVEVPDLHPAGGAYDATGRPDALSSTGTTPGATTGGTYGASGKTGAVPPSPFSAGSSLGTSLSKGYSTYVAPGGQVRKEVVGGGAAAAVGLLLMSLRRRRKRRRTLTRR